MHIVIFNGPPDSGKDVGAKYLRDKFGYTVLEMKGALRKVAHHMASLHFGNTDFSLQAAELLCSELEFDTSPGRVRKNQEKRPEFGNRTWREFLIWISETVCKPIFGQSIFAMAAVKAIRDSGASRITFSDCGFDIEINTLCQHLDSGCLIDLVHLHRPGCDFGASGDSRNYVSNPCAFGRTLRLINAGDLIDYYAKLKAFMKENGRDV